MIQRFIELGQGYSDLYELIEIAKTNQHRLHQLIRFDTVIDNRALTSLAVILKPAEPGKFMPIYLCREGIPQPETIENQRYALFNDFANDINKDILHLSIKPASTFAELDLYYQYVIGVLRMNKYIPELQ